MIVIRVLLSTFITFLALSVSAWSQAEAGAEAFLAGGPRLGGPAEQELDLIALRDQGVRVILDLRHPEEGTQAESEAAARLGFVYVNLPVREAASPAVVRNVGVLLDAYGPENVYLHCKSGQRAAEVWGRHQLARGANPDVVFAGASAWGLSEKRVGLLRQAAGLAPEPPAPPAAPPAPAAPLAPPAPALP
jgi:protein tyrosine phosphatase (PTP) superfamily phosphohydrolase (DUF442 family)